MPPCFNVTFRAFDRAYHGLKTVTAHGDGSTMRLEWYKSYVENPFNWGLVYNIYWSTDKRDVFSEGVKTVANSSTLSLDVQSGFKPGDIYYFAVRPAAHEPGTLNYGLLPQADGLVTYPEAVLREDITETDLVIPLDDVSTFPPTGIIIIGAEIIKYSMIDMVDNSLILLSAEDRGIYGYEARIHTTDGYDGVRTYEDPFVRLWKGFEEDSGVVGLEENKFELSYARTDADGYYELKDIVAGTSNLSTIDEDVAGFPSWDNAGWDRNPVTDYLSGKCIGTYFGGEFGCADGYDSEGGIRGLSIQDHINMREEYLLEITGDLVTLVRRMYEGKGSFHHDSTRENSAYRGFDNFGTSTVSGYDQYYNPRRADGKIYVRFGPTKEDIKREEAGLENTFIPNCWTMATPALQDGDFFIRYNADGTEEWRYEIIDVERNKIFSFAAGGGGGAGAQKFTAVRVRKTDPIYQWRAVKQITSTPSEILTSIGSVSGPGGIPPHMHRIVVSDGQVPSIAQTTSVEQGHNHPVLPDGSVGEVLGHTHTLILP